MIVQVNEAVYIEPIVLRDSGGTPVTDKVNADFTKTATLLGTATTVTPTIAHTANGVYTVVATFTAVGTWEVSASVDVDGETVEDFQTVQVVASDQVISAITNIVTYSAAPSALIGTPLPAHVDLIIIQGMDMVIPVRLEEIDGSLRDLTGATAHLEVHQNYGTTTLLDLSTSNGRIAVGSFGSGATAYNLELFIGKAVSSALTNWGVGVQDLEVTFSTGDTARVWEGSALLDRESTT